MINKLFFLCFVLFLGSKPAHSTIKQNDDCTLKNKYVELVFAKGPAYLLKTFKTDGVDLLPPAGSKTELWKITCKGKKGENPVFLPQRSDYLGATMIKGKNQSTLVFTWNLYADTLKYPVHVSVTLADTSRLPEWNIDAKMPDGWQVDNIAFPRFEMRRFKDAKVILSSGYGTEYALETNKEFESKYPSWSGSMQLMMVHNEAGTIYFSSQDKSGSGKNYLLNTRKSSIIMEQETVTSLSWTKDGKFQLPWPTVLGFTKNRWQYAVEKWYRPFSFQTAWGEKTISQRKISEWIKNADLWMRPMHSKKETLEEVKKAINFFSMKNIGLHWYYWHQNPFDTKYPEYFPTQTGFADMVKAAQDMGAHVTPYINGRLWDPNTASFVKLDGASALCRKVDGSLYTEIYGSKVMNMVACPGSPVWQETLSGVTGQILKELHTDGVYIDQIGAAICEPCYATNHNHPLGNGNWWYNAYRQIISDSRSRYFNDSQALTTEENAECYIDLFDMMLTVNSPHGSDSKTIPLFPMVYSDRCIYSGYTYIPSNLTDGTFRFITMRSLLWGAQLGWVEPGSIIKPETKIEADFLKTLAHFRSKQHDLFLSGRFTDEMIIHGDNPSIQIPNYETARSVEGAEWLDNAGHAYYIIVNMDTKAHKVTLSDNQMLNLKPLSVIRVKKV